MTVNGWQHLYFSQIRMIINIRTEMTIYEAMKIDMRMTKGFCINDKSACKNGFLFLGHVPPLNTISFPLHCDEFDIDLKHELLVSHQSHSRYH